MMNIIVFCETSGAVREELRRRGHNAISVDLLPSQDNSPHHRQCDMRKVDVRGFDGMVFHPTCTFLTSSAEWAYKDPDFIRYPGVGYHQKVKPGTLTGAERRKARELAYADVMWGMGLPIERKVMENPVGALSRMYRKPDVIIQPYMFGDDASKATCIWKENLPTLVIPPKELWHEGWICEYPKGSEKHFRRWGNQTVSGQNILSPGADRWKVRSNTYPGIAKAIADLFEGGQ